MASRPPANTSNELKAKIIPETNQAGIVVCTIDEQRVELRGGPPVKYVYLAPKSVFVQDCTIAIIQSAHAVRSAVRGEAVTRKTHDDGTSAGTL
jgi:hypothetical protein